MSEREITTLKYNLLSGSHIIQLQSINEVKYLCEKTPQLIKEFNPLIQSLTESEHPWVQKEAKKCRDIFVKLKTPTATKKREKWAINDIDTYIKLLFSFFKEKSRQKIRDLYKTLTGEEEHSINTKEMLKHIIEQNTPNYLSIIFSESKISFIAARFGLKYEDNLSYIISEIHKQIGFKIGRGAYLEL